MKIKQFYKQARETLEQFEERVNSFTTTVSVRDIKLAESPYGTAEDFDSVTSVLVLYRWGTRRAVSRV